jgi:mRNA-degrading endonuclease RelE of RelBE toxin-antitoxin system
MNNKNIDLASHVHKKRVQCLLIMYEIIIPKRVEKQISKLRINEKKKLVQLLDDLRDLGPERKEWMNYSKLSRTEYHCHLSYHWVACWRKKNNKFVLEVYYVGSRENAPY